MNTPRDGARPLVDDELDVLESMVPLERAEIVELGCGNAKLARELLARHPGCHVTGLEVDERQHAKNLARPQDGLCFLAGGAQAIPLPDDSQDVAIMLKSLHHVPIPEMARALAEIARVLRPGGLLYVSEPVYAGALNDVIRVYNDEGTVRAAAQAALDEALRGDAWDAAGELRFEMPVHYRDFDDFEHRHMHPTHSDFRLDDTLVARARAAFEPNCGPDGAHFTRPMHVRLLRRRA